MKKIYIIIAGAFLILLIITSMLLSLVKKPVTTQKNSSLFPTSIPRDTSVQKNLPTTGGDQGLKDLSNLSNSSNESNPPFDPIETLDFKAAYVPTLNKIVVEKKTPQAEAMFDQWVDQNQLNEAISEIGGKKNILFTNEKIIPTPSDSIHKLENKVKDFFQLMDDLNSIGKGSSTNQSPAINNPTPVSNNQSPSQSPATNNQSLTYYAQCGDQGSLPLPDGGTLCSAGCGPTTVAMISSSYMDKKYDPKTVVGLYKSNDYLLGNDGSRYSDAHELLKSLGLKTTDYLVFDLEKADTVVPQLRKYLNAGWTFFTLASFCEKGCGHYFWITDIDSKGNIFAYDPAYGRYQIPYNENSRYPYPLYRLAFGVKR